MYLRNLTWRICYYGLKKYFAVKLKAEKFKTIIIRRFYMILSKDFRPQLTPFRKNHFQFEQRFLENFKK